MKVLIVSEMSVPYATGGGETRYALLARELVRAGHAVTWLSMRQRDSPGAETIDGVRHLHRGPRIAAPPLRPLWQKLHFMAAVLWHLLRHRYDVVDCQTYAPLPAAWLGCRLRGMPMVATIHDTSAAPQGPGADDQWFSTLDRLLAQRVERGLYRLPYTRVLTVSDAVRDDLVRRMGVPAARISAVPNAIDIERIDAVAAGVAGGAETRPVDLVFVGRLVPHKHPEHLLAAAAAVRARRLAAGLPDLRITLVGGGPEAANVAAAAHALGLDGALQMTGEVARHDDVIAHVKSARLLVLPSTREGFGLVLAEAMACGTAVLAYDLPPVRETLGPELADCLVAPGDIDALGRGIERLLDDAAWHARCVAVGRARAVQRFGAAPFAQRVAEVYRRALQNTA